MLIFVKSKRFLYHVICRVGFEMALRVSASSAYNGLARSSDGANALPEECVTQHNVVYIPTCRIIEHVLVYEKEEWHVDFLARQKLLLLKAETFYFGKVRRNLTPSVSAPSYHGKAFDTPDQGSHCMLQFQ